MAPRKRMEHTQTITFKAEPETLAALLDLRKLEEDAPTKSDMIRRLVARAHKRAMEASE